jgi:hypothetical protein
MATEATAAKPERLTWKEICAREPDRWVVLADADWVNETDFDFRSAELVGSHARRADTSPDVRATLARGLRVACFWTGELRAPTSRFH